MFLYKSLEDLGTYLEKIIKKTSKQKPTGRSLLKKKKQEKRQRTKNWTYLGGCGWLQRRPQRAAKGEGVMVEKLDEGRSMNGRKKKCTIIVRKFVHYKLVQTVKICTPNFHSHFSFVNLYFPNSASINFFFQMDPNQFDWQSYIIFYKITTCLIRPKIHKIIIFFSPSFLPPPPPNYFMSNSQTLYC